jgi:hypothetical protein
MNYTLVGPLVSFGGDFAFISDLFLFFLRASILAFLSSLSDFGDVAPASSSFDLSSS